MSRIPGLSDGKVVDIKRQHPELPGASFARSGKTFSTSLIRFLIFEKCVRFFVHATSLDKCS